RRRNNIYMLPPLRTSCTAEKQYIHSPSLAHIVRGGETIYTCSLPCAQSARGRGGEGAKHAYPDFFSRPVSHAVVVARHERGRVQMRRARSGASGQVRRRLRERPGRRPRRGERKRVLQ